MMALRDSSLRIMLATPARRPLSCDTPERPPSFAICRCRAMQMSGNMGTPEGVVKRALAANIDVSRLEGILAAPTLRSEQLAESAALALDHLPAGAVLDGKVFFVIGYDIGIAAPPDVAINVGHEHFLHTSTEVAHYITHEAHHVGFMGFRPPPPMAGLDDARTLRRIVAYFTELEGRAVHAARDRREREGQLGDDDDYRIYVDSREARRIARRYLEQCSTLESSAHLSDDQLGAVMEAMTSGERLFYRAGALVCRALDRERGRRYLADSVAVEGEFQAHVKRVLSGLG